MILSHQTQVENIFGSSNLHFHLLVRHFLWISPYLLFDLLYCLQMHQLVLSNLRLFEHPGFLHLDGLLPGLTPLILWTL